MDHLDEEQRGYRAKSSVVKMQKSVGEAGVNLSTDMINRILVESVSKQDLLYVSCCKGNLWRDVLLSGKDKDLTWTYHSLKNNWESFQKNEKTRSW